MEESIGHRRLLSPYRSRASPGFVLGQKDGDMVNAELSLARNKRPRLLLVSPYKDDPATVEAMLAQYSIAKAASVVDALANITRDRPAVVLCEEDLPDGGWNDLLAALADMEPPPPLVVMSRTADERLWSKVLRRGGFDVVAKPLDREEVCRIVPTAEASNRNLRAFAQAS
jgi:DNA-binding NtrC family response regulator